MKDPHVLPAVVIGAGPAGLACAACLKRTGVRASILEKADTVGAAWHRHYDRLRLHTNRRHSGLPGLAMAKSYPRYPARTQFIEYLERYSEAADIHPRFGVNVVRVFRRNGSWLVETSSGMFAAANVIVATGLADRPTRPYWPGEGRFGGDVQHSTAYRNPAPFAGKRVLVVGLGNSGAEIALDLADAGVAVSVAVRGAVNIVPRDFLGVPITSVAVLLRPLPPVLADMLSAPIVKLSIGPLDRLGLRHSETGPFTSIAQSGRVPLLDSGTVARIRDGTVAVYPGIRSVDEGKAEFEDGSQRPFDEIIAATGFRPNLRPLLSKVESVLRDDGMPRVSGGPTSKPGLYFCGFRVSPAGQLREIGLEACRIAGDVASRLRAE